MNATSFSVGSWPLPADVSKGPSKRLMPSRQPVEAAAADLPARPHHFATDPFAPNHPDGWTNKRKNTVSKREWKKKKSRTGNKSRNQRGISLNRGSVLICIRPGEHSKRSR